MIYKKIKQYAPEKLIFAYIGIVLSTLAVVFLMLSFYYLFHFLNSVVVLGNYDLANIYAFKIVVFLILNVIVYFLSLWSTHILAFRLETNLKKIGLKKIMRASFSFYDTNESGRIRKILDDNTILTHTSVAHLIPDISNALILPLVGGVLIFSIDIKMGFVFLLAFALGLLFILKMMGNQSFMKQYMDASEKMNSGAVEYIRGIQVLKIFQTGIEEIKEFYNSVVDYSKLALQYSMSCRSWYVLFQVLFNGIFLFVLFFYFVFDYDVKIFLVRFFFFILLSGIIFVALSKVMYLGMYIFQANNAINSIENLFTKMDEGKVNHGSVNEISKLDIDFINVNFSYDDTLIIDDLNLHLDAGKMYALVGPSGSGKSTLAKLISGFYPLDSGMIKLGGIALEQYSQSCLASNISNVFQDAKLFKQTIYENVLIGNKNASKQEVMEALHLAQCDDIISKFKDKENTLIGSKGVHLSGGEIQRITIARAILKDAKLVILDEASAAADPENEYELQKALSNLMKGKTVIMIAHRLSSIKNADEILVMENGKIIERGNHKELMNKDTRYKGLQIAFAKANDWRVK